MAEITVRLEIRGAVAALTLNAPPVNALSADVRKALSAQLSTLNADTSVKAIILRAEGRLFSAGADIREFGGPQSKPILSDLCLQIEASPKPVIAALQGNALGGGAEIALAAHYRLALPDVMIGLPEVTLGLIPGAGGTQRLPRLIGVASALSMMLDGRSVTADTADALGLIDGVVRGDLNAAAFAFADGLLVQGLGPRPTSARRDKMRDGAEWLKTIEQSRDAEGAGLQARGRIIDCVEASLLLPFDAGLAFERAAFADCLADPRSRALRRLFFAERRVSPDILTRDADGHRSLGRVGVALAARLGLAQQNAAKALLRDGTDAVLIDGAFVDQGFGAGPLGGMEGNVGPVGAEIARQINAAVMAEGCRLIDEGAMPDAAGIDVLAVFGLGYPRHTGGPMQLAMQDGLLHLSADMRLWAQQDPVWSVPPLLSEAVRNAGGFDAVSQPTSV